MGSVYKVRHRFFDEIRVIKVMQPQLELVPELKERFLGEAKRGKQLRHPNLAEVIDFSIAADGTSYMVMEYIEGVNLREVLARNGGPLDYREVVPIAEQALAAMQFLHEKKFVHRDISPDNLMLTLQDGGEPRVKLIDLGVAKSLDATRQLTMTGRFIGKFSYASPEHFGGDVEPRSDIYSLGIVLYEVLTGEKPITGTNPMKLIDGHISRPPRPFSETDPEGRVPEPLRNVVLKALEKNPENRWPSASAFATALRAAIPAAHRRPLSVPVVTQPSPTEPPPEPTKPATVSAASAATVVTTTTAAAKPRRTWAVVIPIALVLLVFAIVYLRRMSRKPEPVAPPVTSTVASTTSTVASTTTVTVTPPVIETGQLVINALPWGEVTSVTDSAGTERLKGGRVETPLMLSLPAGEYKVRLSNPNSKKNVVVDASVKPNEISRCEAELDRIDADAYVAGIGK